MKRLTAIICLIAMLTSMYACGKNSRPASPEPGYAYEEYEEHEVIEAQEETEPEITGDMTLEDLKGVDYMTGFLIHYPDDSFDYYYGGQVINWGMPELYTYGTERSAYNLVMDSYIDKTNQERLKEGELVFITTKDTNVYARFFPVIESGYAMSGKNANGITESLLWTRETGTEFDYVNGLTRTPERRNIKTINGVYVDDEIVFEKDKDHKYVTLKEGDEYTIGEANGTTLVENTYCVDSIYYLHTYNTAHKLYDYPDKTYSFELQPTTYGYANVDFSELPAGDYVAMYSYWSEDYGQRNVYMTHIIIE